MDARTAGRRMTELLGLDPPPVAVTFAAAAPAGIRRVPRSGPAGCAYWKQAGEGAVFYTEAADHFNCPVGSYTHGVALPRRKAAFGVAVYAPLALTPTPPDVVLVRGRARQIMLVAEAARAAGLAGDAAAMGRPACAMIPAVLDGPGAVTSLGCIGNRSL
jgi:uncharacterized protein (DUF169 family)